MSRRVMGVGSKGMVTKGMAAKRMVAKGMVYWHVSATSRRLHLW